MGEEVIIKSLRLCASEESRCVVCEYRHHKGCIAQLQRDAADALERPGACVGCGYENSCSTRGCAVLRKISRIVARAEGGAEDDA